MAFYSLNTICIDVANLGPVVYLNRYQSVFISQVDLNNLLFSSVIYLILQPAVLFFSLFLSFLLSVLSAN